ncbi:M48 family metallopeptidase [Candidatus Symbiobacter mobilis]|nr:M48 family metallopeptidase [Candidatus Symbiobacter mobilis]
MDGQMAQWWGTVFLLAVFVAGALQGWLAWRQVRHVRAHRDRVPAAFAETIPLNAHQKAADYAVAKVRLSTVEDAVGLCVLLAWTVWGGLAVLHTALLQWLGAGMVQQLALLGAFALVQGVIDLPLSWYRAFVLEERFGFNRQTLGLWWIDLGKSFVIGMVVGLPIAAAVLWIMGNVEAWWWWAWGLWAGLNLLLLVVYPIWIAPWFHKFRPLEDVALRERVSALLERCGFAVQGVYVVDASRRSAHANAYFTGLGRSKRVVFFDTLLAQLRPEEIEAVLAHELGHFRRFHIHQRLVLLLGLGLAGFVLLGWASQQAWFFAGMGIVVEAGSHPALSLLSLLLLSPLLSLLLSPALASLSRRHEFEADAFAARHVRAQDLCSALLCLYRDNASTLTPDPWYAAFHATHPGACERLERLGCQTRQTP